MFGSFRDLAFLGAAAGSGVALDPDAQAYITAVETVDGQSLEAGVRTAINDFVVGCKADGIWTAIKASCILAGARTLNGALVPLAGAAPTNFNFVSGDYNRKTGLVGNGSTKYLNSNQSLINLPVANCGFGVYCTQAATATSAYLSSNATSGQDFVQILPLITPQTTIAFASRNDNTQQSAAGTASSTGFIGSTRSSLASYQFRVASTNTTQSISALAARDTQVLLFARNQSPVTFLSNARLAFYSIGESLDLALLDARVTALINAFGAAIP
jgi:hypothetical protein